MIRRWQEAKPLQPVLPIRRSLSPPLQILFNQDAIARGESRADRTALHQTLVWPQGHWRKADKKDGEIKPPSLVEQATPQQADLHYCLSCCAEGFPNNVKPRMRGEPGFVA